MAKFRKSNLDLQAGQKILFNNDTANRIQYNSSTSDLEISGSTVSLIHDGNKALGTLSGGVQVFDTTNPANYLQLKVTSTVMLLNSDTNGTAFQVVSQKTAGGDVTLFGALPDGSSTLYYAGNDVARTFESGANIGQGIIMLPDSGTGCQYGTDEGDGIIYNWDHGGDFRIRGENSLGTAKDMFWGDPGAGIILYYAGIDVFETNRSGITLRNPDNDETQIFTGQDVANLGDLVLWPGSAKTITLSAGYPGAKIETYANGSSFAGFKLYEPTGDTFDIFVSSDNFLYLESLDSNSGVKINDQQGSIASFSYGATTIYAVGVGVMKVRTGGMSIGNDTSTDDRLGIYHSGGVMFMVSEDDGAPFRISAVDSNAQTVIGINFDPDNQGMHFYHNNLDTVLVRKGGITLRNPANNDSEIFTGQDVANLGDLVLYSPNNVTVSAGNDTKIISTNDVTVSAGGDIRLQHKVTEGGVYITDGIADPTRLFISEDDFYIRNTDRGGYIWFQGTNAAGATKSIMAGTPDGLFRIYHAGLEMLETGADGIYLHNNAMSFRNTGGVTYFRSHIHGDPIYIQAENADGATQLLLLGDPDGATSLYYQNIDVLSTNRSGIILRNPDNDETEIFTGQDVANLGDLVINGGTNNVVLSGGLKFTDVTYSMDFTQAAAGSWWITNETINGGINFVTTDAGGTNTVAVFEGSNNGRVSIYYNSAAAFRSMPGGIQFGSGSVTGEITQSGNDLYFDQNITAGGFLFQSGTGITLKSLSNLTGRFFVGDEVGNLGDLVLYSDRSNFIVSGGISNNRLIDITESRQTFGPSGGTSIVNRRNDAEWYLNNTQMLRMNWSGREFDIGDPGFMNIQIAASNIIIKDNTTTYLTLTDAGTGAFGGTGTNQTRFRFTDGAQGWLEGAWQATRLFRFQKGTTGQGSKPLFQLGSSQWITDISNDDLLTAGPSAISTTESIRRFVLSGIAASAGASKADLDNIRYDLNTFSSPNSASQDDLTYEIHNLTLPTSASIEDLNDIRYDLNTFTSPNSASQDDLTYEIHNLTLPTSASQSDILSVSGASVEQDNRLQEQIDAIDTSTLSAASKEADNRHAESDGSSHTFIDQAVTVAGTPTFGTVDATTDFTVDGLVLTADTITNDANLSIMLGAETAAVFQINQGPQFYFNDLITMEIIADGFYLYDNAGTNYASFSHDGGNAIWKNWTHGGQIQIYGESIAAGALEPIFIADPDGAATIYYNGEPKIATSTDGIDVTGNIDVTTNFTVGGTVITDGQIVDNGIFYIQPATSLNITGAGIINVGAVDTTYGNLNLYGAASNQGGMVNLFNAANQDTTIDYYRIQAVLENLYIGPDTDANALEYRGATNKWLFKHDGIQTLATTAGGIVIGTGDEQFQLTIDRFRTDTRGIIVGEGLGQADVRATKANHHFSQQWLSSNSMIAFGENIENSANPGIFLYRTGAGQTTGRGYRWWAHNSSGVMSFDISTEANTTFGSEENNNWTQMLAFNVGSGPYVPSGDFRIGSDDEQFGFLRIFGDGPGSTQGAEIDLYTAADHDGTINRFIIQTTSDDLYIGPNTDTNALIYNGANNRWQFTVPVDFLSTSNISAASQEGDNRLQEQIDAIPSTESVSAASKEADNRHAESDGSSHSFIDQDVTITGTPTFGTVDASTDFTVGGTVITNNTITDDGTLLIVPTTALQVQGAGVLNVGTNNSLQGRLNLFGPAGDTTGGLLLIYQSADNAATQQYYIFQTLSDESLAIGSAGDIDMLKFLIGGTIQSTVAFDVDAAFSATTVDADTDFTVGGTVITDGDIADTGILTITPTTNMRLQGGGILQVRGSGNLIEIGQNDAGQEGNLYIYGGTGDPLGGNIRLYNDANEDTFHEYMGIRVNDGIFEIGTNVNNNAVQIDMTATAMTMLIELNTDFTGAKGITVATSAGIADETAMHGGNVVAGPNVVITEHKDAKSFEVSAAHYAVWG